MQRGSGSELLHAAVACFHSSPWTYASLERLKEKPFFPHHLNRPVSPLLDSLEGFPLQKPTSLVQAFLRISGPFF